MEYIEEYIEKYHYLFSILERQRINMGKPKTLQPSDPNLAKIADIEVFPSLLRGLLLAMKVETLKLLCDLLKQCNGDFTAVSIGGFQPISRQDSRLMECYVKDHRASAAWYAEEFDWEEIPDDLATEEDESDLVTVPKTVGEVMSSVWNGLLDFQIIPQQAIPRKTVRVKAVRK